VPLSGFPEKRDNLFIAFLSRNGIILKVKKLLLLSLIMMAGFMPKGFSGPQIKLPSPDAEGGAPLGRVLNERRSVRKYAESALGLEEVSQVLWAACGKNKWGTSTSPSAGALYPLTVYLVAGDVKGMPCGLYRYRPEAHSLLLVSSGDLRSELSRVCLNQPWVRQAPAVIVISADYNITTSHYGSRGKRYVAIEVGHAGQNIYL
jgi:hypothetical protein